MGMEISQKENLSVVGVLSVDGVSTVWPAGCLRGLFDFIE
jgi:hypothetical protein